MRLSQRATSVVGGTDDGWGLYYRARAMKAAGEPVVMLTIGDHDTPADPSILDAMDRAARGGHTGYTPVNGMTSLREAVARRTTADGVATEADEVCITCGGQAGLFAAMMVLLDAGDSAVVLDPYYATYAQTVRGASGRPIVVACRPEDGFQPDAATIEAALAPDTRAILINTPNNPTGAVYSRASLEAIADLARRRDLWVVSDEVYHTQVWAGRHVSPRALPGMTDRTLVIGSMSKSHGLTGFRIGWITGPREAVALVSDLAISTNYGLPGFVQDACLHALTSPEGAAAETALADLYRSRRDAALDVLRGAEGLIVRPSEGGMYIMLDIRPTGHSGEAFGARLLEREGIAVMPGESFGHAAAGHLRVALTVPEPVLRDALSRLAALAAELSNDAEAARSPAFSHS